MSIGHTRRGDRFVASETSSILSFIWPITSVVLSADGKTAFTAAKDGTIIK